ncbi:succinate dehydrogenase assembly factor 2 [Extensimonas sp. H3M7-6]|jgi:antitoxin CptB|uniref:FAD assembly factor SdhE n=1 Tax=Extensimonas soli TaxID=3031322 RepID=UPI0023DCADD7|nr:succinate dehydrogenase assembly factor 2 [Extensimonas sp. H3M7-6]MDF1480774.1 succinate dehydrogenase assembly factor 2 [Extensimonas sp. H3M7-6]
MGESPSAADALLNERELSKLHWRCRRGLLENDLFISRFFARFESELTQSHARGLLALMDLADNDLLDLLLRRREPAETLDTPEVRTVLAMLRQGTAAAAPDTANQPQ